MDWNWKKIHYYISNYIIQPSDGTIFRREDLEKGIKKEEVKDENTKISVRLSNFIYTTAYNLQKKGAYNYGASTGELKNDSASTLNGANANVVVSYSKIAEDLIRDYGLDGTRNEKNEPIWSIIESDGHIELELKDSTFNMHIPGDVYAGSEYPFLKGPKDYSFSILRYLAIQHGYDIDPASWKVDIDKSNFQNSGKIKVTIDFAKIAVPVTQVKVEPQEAPETYVIEQTAYTTSTMEQGNVTSLNFDSPAEEMPSSIQPDEVPVTVDDGLPNFNKDNNLKDDQKTQSAEPQVTVSTPLADKTAEAKKSTVTQASEATDAVYAEAVYRSAEDRQGKSYIKPQGQPSSAAPKSAKKRKGLGEIIKDVFHSKTEKDAFTIEYERLNSELEKARATGDQQKIMDINYELDQLSRRQREKELFDLLESARVLNDQALVEKIEKEITDFYTEFEAIEEDKSYNGLLEKRVNKLVDADFIDNLVDPALKDLYKTAVDDASKQRYAQMIEFEKMRIAKGLINDKIDPVLINLLETAVDDASKEKYAQMIEFEMDKVLDELAKEGLNENDPHAISNGKKM